MRTTGQVHGASGWPVTGPVTGPPDRRRGGMLYHTQYDEALGPHHMQRYGQGAKPAFGVSGSHSAHLGAMAC